MLRSPFLFVAVLMSLPSTAAAAVITVNVSGQFLPSAFLSVYQDVVSAPTPFALRFTYDSSVPGVPSGPGVTRYAFSSDSQLTLATTVYQGGFYAEAINVDTSGIFVAVFDFGTLVPGERRGLTLLSEFGPDVIVGGALPDTPLFFSSHAFNAQIYDLRDPLLGQNDDLLRISFSNQPLSVSATAVPEASSWMMLIAGFGLAGAFLRRKRIAPGAVPSRLNLN